jgi:hypothetical protein
MLTWLPDPQPDELLYSLIARYSDIMAYPNTRHVLLDWYGKASIRAIVDLPSHLDQIVSQTQFLADWSAFRLLEQNTLFPFYAAFHSKKRHQAAQKAMIGNGPAFMLLGLAATQIQHPALLRYCPLCTCEDRNRFGFTYWRRLHQLAGVYVCTEHQVWLEDSRVAIHPSSKKHIFISAEQAIPKELNAMPIPNHKESTILLDLAKRAEQLLTSHYHLNPVELQQRYLNHLHQRKLASYSGRLKVTNIFDELFAHFGTELFSLLQLPLESTENSWWLRLLRKPRAANHTVYHLLMQNFLNLDLNIAAFPKSPFGQKPWRCLNRTSNHFGKLVVQQLEVNLTLNEREPIGTFRCDCGFYYRRVGPDQTPQDTWRIDRMAEYGTIWREALQTVWNNQSYSLRQIARELGFDPVTIKNQARLQGLIGRGLKQKPSTPTVIVVSEATDQIRQQQWLELKQQHPYDSTQQLRSRNPALYTWLYRNAKSWLDENSPINQRIPQESQRINWLARDADIASRLRVAAKAIQQLRKPFVRVSKTRLVSEVGVEAIAFAHLDKLPATSQCLEELVESREDFAVRRIWVVLPIVLTRNAQAPRWKLIRTAGIRADCINLPKVVAALKQVQQEPRKQWQI